MENFSYTDVKVHQNKIQETPTADDEPNQDQDVTKQKTIDDPQETASGPLVQDQSDEDFEIIVDDDVSTCMEAAKVETSHEEVKPATVQDLKDPLLQDKSSENSDTEEYMDCQQTSLASEMNSNENEDGMDITTEEGVKGKKSKDSNQEATCESTDREKPKDLSKVMEKVDEGMNLGEEGIVPLAEQDVLSAVTTQETQKHPLESKDVNEPKCGRNLMPSEPIKHNQKRVEASAEKGARKSFPGKAKQERVQNLEEAVKYETQGKQHELYNAKGFECYDPDVAVESYDQSPGTTRRRFLERKEQKKTFNSYAKGCQGYQYQEEKKHRTGRGLTNIISTIFSSPGNRSQSGMVLSPPHQASSSFSTASGASYPREGSNLAGGSNVFTLNDFPVPTPFERCGLVSIKLKNRAKGEIPDEPEPEAVKEAKSGIENIFIESSESNLNLEESYEQEAMKQHKKQLDEIFDGIHQKIEMLRIDVTKKFDTLTVQQQEQVLKFWLMVEEFIEVLLKYIRTRFDDVLGRIRRGYKIDRHAIKKIFNYIIEFLKAIF